MYRVDLGDNQKLGEYRYRQSRGVSVHVREMHLGMAILGRVPPRPRKSLDVQKLVGHPLLLSVKNQEILFATSNHFRAKVYFLFICSLA